jgi:myo-inositol 2-dehydrogenase / D-chiro-inositol 1-dehydrogenase
MADISIGVIGAGGMGSRHVMNLERYVKGARVVAIYDLDQARAGQVAAECGSARAFSDPLQLIQDAGVDAVVIASPDPTHAEFVHECLRHHKPVLCEKPLATTADEALKIIEAEQAQGQGRHKARPLQIAVGFMRRFDPQHVAVRRVVAAGEIGRPILFKGVHRNPMIPSHQPGEFFITNSAIHDIDSARWLLGQEITEVYVRGVRTHTSFSDETRDMVLIQMALSGQCLATAEVSVAVEYGYEVSAEIVGERGSAVTMQPDTVLVRSREARSVAVPKNHLARFQEAYISELTEWVHSVQTEQAFTGANAWDGYMSLLVADACIQSLKSGTAVPVSTPTRPGLYTEPRSS